MTNNPTIDGVSREEFERSVATLYGYADLRKRNDGCYINDQIQSAWWGWKERSALIDAPAVDAPAVERQPIKNASEVAYNLQAENARLEARITQLESEAEFAAATYQAARDRIAELESGRGEPVAWANGEQLRLCAASPREVQPNNPMMHNLPRNIAGSALKTGYCNTPLYAAPPVPVAAPTDLLQRLAYALSQVGRPDHLVDYDAVILAREDLRACLDATAALNGLKA